MLRNAGASAVVAALATLAFATPARADTPSGTALSTVAVQNRQDFERHEFDVAVGVLPLDAFTKGITVSGSYTLHFDDLYAWEMIQGSYSFPVDTHLKADLAALDVQPTPFERVIWYATSNFVWKPIYWKGALLNENVIHGAIFFVAGGGYGTLTRSGRPVVDLGMGFRFYMSRSVSFRLDLRDLAFFTTSDIHNELWIGLGLSL